MRDTLLHVVPAQRARWLGVLTAALILVLAAPPAYHARAAGPPIDASGAYVRTSFAQSNIRIMGEVTMFDFTETQALTGAISGTTVLQGSCAVPPTLQAVCQAISTFTGTVDGHSGTAEFRDIVFIDLTTGTLHGSFTIISGTDDLATLHGHGTFQAVRGSGSYAAQLVFGP